MAGYCSRGGGDVNGVGLSDCMSRWSGDSDRPEETLDGGSDTDFGLGILFAKRPLTRGCFLCASVKEFPILAYLTSVLVMALVFF